MDMHHSHLPPDGPLRSVGQTIYLHHCPWQYSYTLSVHFIDECLLYVSPCPVNLTCPWNKSHWLLPCITVICMHMPLILFVHFLSCLYALKDCHIKCDKQFSTLSVSLFIWSADVAVSLEECRCGSAVGGALSWECRSREAHQRRAFMLVKIKL